jgi:integrase
MWRGDNPCWRLKGKIGGVEEVYSKKLPQADALLRFLAALKDTAITSAAGARLMVMTSLGIGTRMCEVLGLQPNDVDGEAETVKIQRDWVRGRGGPTKTTTSKRTRQAPGIAGELLAYAKSRGIKPDGFIFGRPDRDGDPPDDRDLQHYVFGPAARRAGVYSPGFGLRRFRGINISWRQTVGGAEPLEAQKAAGHKRLSTTWLYTQNEEERDRAHVQAILEHMQGKPEGGVQ